jgi:hypothetical protein
MYKREIKLKVEGIIKFIEIRLYLYSKYKLLESSFNQTNKQATFKVVY